MMCDHCKRKCDDDEEFYKCDKCEYTICEKCMRKQGKKCKKCEDGRLRHT